MVIQQSGNEKIRVVSNTDDNNFIDIETYGGNLELMFYPSFPTRRGKTVTQIRRNGTSDYILLKFNNEECLQEYDGYWKEAQIIWDSRGAKK